MRNHLKPAVALLAIMATLVSTNGLADDSDLETRAREEVVALHEVIEAWLAGTIPDNDAAYARFSEAMAQDFEIISPAGVRSDRATIVASLRAAHGAQKTSFRIEVRNVRTRLLRPPLALLTYEEWQFAGDQTTARLSSVLMRDDASKPGGVAWVHLQETWLPGMSPDS